MYEAREKWERDQRSRIKSEEKKAEAHAKAEGKEIDEKMVAVNMLKERFTVEQVVKVTDFSKSEVEGFLKELH